MQERQGGEKEEGSRVKAWQSEHPNWPGTPLLGLSPASETGKHPPTVQRENNQREVSTPHSIVDNLVWVWLIFDYLE